VCGLSKLERDRTQALGVACHNFKPADPNLEMSVFPIKNNKKYHVFFKCGIPL
jgi:hypothetical protein